MQAVGGRASRVRPSPALSPVEAAAATAAPSVESGRDQCHQSMSVAIATTSGMSSRSALSVQQVPHILRTGTLLSLRLQVNLAGYLDHKDPTQGSPRLPWIPQASFPERRHSPPVGAAFVRALIHAHSLSTLSKASEVRAGGICQLGTCGSPAGHLRSPQLIFSRPQSPAKTGLQTCTRGSSDDRSQ